MLVMAMVVAGVVAFPSLGIDRFPKTDLPTVFIRTGYPGAASQEVESEISQIVEDAVSTVAGIEELRSISTDGSSIVLITFSLARDIDAAVQDVRDVVSSVTNRLPRTIDPPVVQKSDLDSSPVMSIAVSGERTASELYMLAELPFPPAADYDGFPQVENGVGSVRYLEELIATEQGTLPDLHGQRVLVCTGTAMGKLMPHILPSLERATGATFELAVIENSYYGPAVTTAGLLPGDDFRRALAGRRDISLALLPAEAVSDAGIFVDDVTLAAVEATAPMPISLSYHFTDALAGAGVR